MHGDTEQRSRNQKRLLGTRLQDSRNTISLCRPVLAACCRTIRQPFKLSNMLGRTLHPGSHSQDLHVDLARDRHGWPMVGFIVMIDEFRNENGATRFLPGSHLSSSGMGNESIRDLVPACGPSGSVIVYNGSVLHGPDQTRRTIRDDRFKELTFVVMQQGLTLLLACAWRPRNGSDPSRDI
jgi:ectoine hydroxylase-related dioxygenase (phytanoyl-CoA dioxygenase family)